MANKITIDLTSLDLNLNPNETYNIVIEENFVIGEDLLPSYPSESVLSFNTSNPPVLVNTNPDLGETDVLRLSIDFEFDVSVFVKSGNFYLYEDSPTGDILIETIPYNNSRITIQDNFLSVDVSGLVEEQTTYYILSDSNIITDILGVGTGITSEDIVKWTTGFVAPSLIVGQFTLNINSLVSNNITDNRSYYGETENTLYTSNVPVISGSGIYTLRLRAYNLSLTTLQGDFSIADDSIIASNFSYTGNASALNNILSTIKFYPNKGVSSNLRIQFTLEQDGNIVEKNYFDLLYQGLGNNVESFTFTETQINYEFPYLYQKYYNGAKVLVVGGGGSGNYGYTTGTIPYDPTDGYMGSGGGGGGVVEGIVSVDFSAPQTIQVGAGGQPVLVASWPRDGYTTGEWPLATLNGGDGGDSSAFGLVARGGKGASFVAGYDYGTRTKGGDSGAPTTFTGATGSTYDRGGGGGGAAQNGFAQNSSAPGTPEIRDGGDGVYVSLVDVGYYGGGGASKGGSYILSFDPYQEAYRLPAGGLGGGGNGPEYLSFQNGYYRLKSGQPGQNGRGGGGAAGIPPLGLPYTGTAAPQPGGSGIVKISLLKNLT